MKIQLNFNSELCLPYELPNRIYSIFTRIWKRLEINFSDIPKYSERGYTGILVQITKDETWTIYNETIIRKRGNIVEIRKDFNRSLENEIFKHLPVNIRKCAFNW